MTAHSELVARLEGASEGSREIGVELLLHFGWHRSCVGHFYGPLYHWSAPDRKPCLISGDEDHLPNPTTSLDAALALAERVLPGWDFIVGRTNGGLTIHAQVGPGEMQFGNTPALALCIAVLRATATQPSDDGEKT
jgi:hypothetical protein